MKIPFENLKRIVQGIVDTPEAQSLILAFIEVESGGDPLAVRYEPAYKYLVDPLIGAKAAGTTVDTEVQCQKMSWGLMQIMGGVARELGFKGQMPQLCDPAVGLYWSCKLIQRIHESVQTDFDVMAAYNGGLGAVRNSVNGHYSNQPYVDKVNAAWQKYKTMT